MANRNRQDQQAHNRGVRHEADELAGDDWNVRADHQPDNQYDEPPTVNGRVPDVYATKAGHTRIIEIETDPNDDHDQHTAFRRHAGQHENRVFYGWIVDATGRRIQRFE
ncbi:MAG: hypothetical protein ABEL51_11085 [Salinibacter sp.]